MKKTDKSVPTQPATPSQIKFVPSGIAFPAKQKAKWIYRHENEFRRALACWAVSQHPYHRPPKLFEACDAFVDFIGRRHHWSMGVARVHSRTIRRIISEFCRSNQFTVPWNKPRKGRHTVLFVTRKVRPKPEYDFIDLDALAGNICRQILKEE